MNYIELLNHYWSLREQGILDRNAGDLYLYLIHKSNTLGWKNPFNQSNALICGFLGINEKTLIANRNKIKQEGLVDFVSGKKGTNTEYRLLPVRKGSHNYRENNRETGNTGQNYSHSNSEIGSQKGSENDSLDGEKSADNNKHKLNETKQDDDEDPAVTGPVPDPGTNPGSSTPPPGPAPPPSPYLLKDVEQLKTECIQDRYFYEPICMRMHLDLTQLSGWLDAFNRELQFKEELKKLPKDYRTHFSNWLKYRDLTMDPDKYSPVPVPKNDDKRNSDTGDGKQSAAGKQSAGRSFLAGRLHKKVDQL